MTKKIEYVCLNLLMGDNLKILLLKILKFIFEKKKLLFMWNIKNIFVNFLCIIKNNFWFD